MNILAPNRDTRIADVSVGEDALEITLRDGRKISVPLTWFPRLKQASRADRMKWELGAAGYGIHWTEIDEDLSVDGLLRGEPAPHA